LQKKKIHHGGTEDTEKKNSKFNSKDKDAEDSWLHMGLESGNPMKKNEESTA
jgi:hypothetical protein